MPPRTVHLTNSYHATSGGIGTFYREMLKYAGEHGRRMSLIVPAEAASIEPVGEHGRIHHLAAKPSPLGDRRYRILWPWGQTARRVSEILRAEQPDLVEVSDKYTLPIFTGRLRAGWVQGVRRPVTVATTHERMDDAARAYLGWNGIGKWLTGVYLKRYYFLMADHHVANSAYTLAEIEPYQANRLIHRSLHVLPMGVDTGGLDPASRSPEMRCRLASLCESPCDSRLLLYVGRLSPEKNLPLLVEMMKHLATNYVLVLAGDGDLRRTLVHPRVRAIGYVSDRGALAQLLAGADVFVHPNDHEPFGIAPLEAMAAGVPLIAPRSGGVLSYANDENAWLCEAEPWAFAHAVEQVFAEPELLHQRVKNARATALQHSWPQVASRYFELYDCLVEQRRASGAD